MRLNELQINTIKTVISSFDEDAEVRLFGSRTDDLKKGGDIDLLIFSQKLRTIDKIKILAQIKKILGDRKIDIIIARDLKNPFVDLIYPTSVVL